MCDRSGMVIAGSVFEGFDEFCFVGQLYGVVRCTSCHLDYVKPHDSFLTRKKEYGRGLLTIIL